MNDTYSPRFSSPYSVIVFALLVCSVLILSSCSGSSVALSGIVTNAYTGEPVPDASVKVGRTNLSTDPNGVFSTSQWRTQDTLEVTAPGYETTVIPLESEPDLQETTVPTVTLETILRPNTLQGAVTNAYTDEPLAGAFISADLDGTSVVSTTTGTDGSYTLEGVPEAFTLVVNASEYSEIQESISQTTTYDAALRPDILTGTITDQYSGEPVEGVTITAGDATATTDADGIYRLEGVPADASEVEVSAEGYATISQALEQATELNVTLRPDVLTAALIDEETDEPISNATIIATETLPGTDVAFTRIDSSNDGEFTLEGLPEAGYIQVLAPGYRKAVLEIKQDNIPTEIALEPFEVKALYVTVAVGASPAFLEAQLDLIERTELNTLVIDLKSDLRDDLGVIYYDSQVPIVQELGTAVDIIDMESIVEEAQRRGIYTIARVQVFSHDNALADARPDWAIRDRETGEVYAELPGPNIRYAWLDPWNRNVWDYNVQLSLEAIEMGFDEINFDYIRFPDWYGDLTEYSQQLEFSQPTDPTNNQQAMYQNIVDFMEYSHRQINGAGAFFSVDLFGRALVAPARVVSQNIEMIAPHVDYICPMPYPSLWWPGYLGFDNPTAHPYEVIYGSLESGQEFVEGQRALLRPWLQDHTDPWQGARVVEYGPAEVRAQIDATEDFGKASGWMLYDSANTYTEPALKPAQ